MEKIIQSGDLDHLHPFLRMMFHIHFPDGLTLQQMASHEIGWVRGIYDWYMSRTEEGGTS